MRAAEAARLFFEKMFYEESEKGIVIRLRLTPNAMATGVKGLFYDEKGIASLKVSVVSPPEKGRANKELIRWLAKTLGTAKSEIEFISGETSHYKKLLIKNSGQGVRQQIEEWNREYDSANN